MALPPSARFAGSPAAAGRRRDLPSARAAAARCQASGIPKSSSQRTRRWREMDSNFQFHARRAGVL